MIMVLPVQVELYHNNDTTRTYSTSSVLTCTRITLLYVPYEETSLVRSVNVNVNEGPRGHTDLRIGN